MMVAEFQFSIRKQNKLSKTGGNIYTVIYAKDERLMRDK